MAEAFLPNPAMNVGFAAVVSPEEARTFAASFTAPGSSLPLDDFITDILRTDGEARAAMFASVLEGRFADEVAIVDGMRPPLAIAHGEAEQLVNLAYLQKLAAPTLWRGSVHVIPAVGHALHQEAPETFTALPRAVHLRPDLTPSVRVVRYATYRDGFVSLRDCCCEVRWPPTVLMILPSRRTNAPKSRPTGRTHPQTTPTSPAATRSSRAAAKSATTTYAPPPNPQNAPSQPPAPSPLQAIRERPSSPARTELGRDRPMESRWMWGEYKRHFPAEERPPVDRSKDPPGSWRADADRYLDPPKNQRIEAECDRIVDREKNEITPALRAIESQDPHRHLVGLERRLKDHDRIKEKVYDNMKAFRMLTRGCCCACS